MMIVTNSIAIILGGHVVNTAWSLLALMSSGLPQYKPNIEKGLPNYLAHKGTSDHRCDRQVSSS